MKNAMLNSSLLKQDVREFLFVLPLAHILSLIHICNENDAVTGGKDGMAVRNVNPAIPHIGAYQACLLYTSRCV